MDTPGASAYEEWDSLSLFASTEELIDFAPYVLSQYPFSHEHDSELHFQIPSFCLNPELNTDFVGMSGSSHYPLVIPDSNQQTVSQESSSLNGASIGYVESTWPGIGSNNHMPVADEISPYFDVFSDAFNTDSNSNSFVLELSNTLMEEGACLTDMQSERSGSLGNNQPEDVSTPLMQLQLKRRPFGIDSIHAATGHSTCTDVSENTKKRRRTLRDLRKTIKGPRNPKKLLSDDNDRDGSNVRPNGSSTCSSEDSDSGELNEEITPPFKASTTLAENGNIGKMKATTRGSATDPQSLYARKRRARINERLRILQNLVPNGTKVDISTMLEEAVHYVKFLQLQIKLLSSDELWMYAPLAYNGMDLDLSNIICPQL